ncbi:glycosyltransferase family 2 protein [Pseudoduganella namucuonensis]|uniref:Glycosyl transferase family 2 n=1 Tax=Pseudoduganella namucuonensis TaxID=1035707 RepID=A0A1I7LVD6_9BURK|nr:glycosyltransferase [Pseudoduganella namucuonensis]SFV13537.1 Glycosyl transferase family 2 [Pseudoduganella namucuonensis]
MSFPLVSIVIPSYKPGHFEQCVKSAIGQSYPHLEILVSDNCPTEAIKEICAKYPQVIYQRNPHMNDKNVMSAFYSGKGHFIKPLYDDDILHPFCVERMVASMSMDPAIQLVFSASQVIDADNLRIETRRPYTVSGSLPGLQVQRSMALGMRNFIGEFTSIMFRRDKLWDIGWKDLFCMGGHDFTFGLADVIAYCNLVKDGAAFYVDEELTYFRRDQRLMSNSNPASNPNFGNCFSDYIDLLVVTHKEGMITDDELRGMEEQVVAVTARLTGVFTQMAPAQARFQDYARTLKSN